MSVVPHVGSKKRKKSDSKPYSQINKCLNEKRRREQENIHIEELAELVSASPSDMSSLSCKPDKCAILKETVNQIRSQKQLNESEPCDDLQQSEVSSSKPNILDNHVYGAILLEVLDGFMFVVDADGKVEFVAENIHSTLKYTPDEITEKVIYEFIHPDDRARFNSNLLLMMPLGNGRDWSSENSFISNKPTKHFNCRFLVKDKDSSEVRMDNTPSPDPQYENLNISANFMLLNDGISEPRNGLTCIARRVPFEEKRIGMNNVEQFTTRIDREGKVIKLDTTNLSQSSSQYLHKELKNSLMINLCHASDTAIFKQHLKEAFETGQATCAPYRFRIDQDRYARIQTKSKIFSADEIVVSTHSIIRENDSSNHQESLRSISSPSTASTSSGPESISDSSTSVNGSIVLSPMDVSNSYGNYSSSVSAPSSSDFALNELVLDIFPSSNWTLEPGSAQSKESDCISVASFVPSPQTAPLSNRSEISAAASPTNSAFVSGLTPSRGGSSAPSPVAMQSRAPTPYGGSCFSPSTSQSSSGRSPPPRALSAKSDSLSFTSVEQSMNSLGQSIRQDRQQLSNQKLRHLLTQNSGDSSLRSNLRQVTPEEVASLLSSRLLDNNISRVNMNHNAIPPPDNVILRDLLSQEDDNCEEVPVEPIKKCLDGSMPNPLLNAGASKAAERSAQQRQLGNNMLRKLLNNDDSDKNYSKNDFIQQLLISNSGNKVSLQNDKIKSENMTVGRPAETSVPKQMNAESSRGAPDVTFLADATMKRKSLERNLQSASKKPNNGTHLAGKNPMLASMLAQTQKPTDKASPDPLNKNVSMMISQLPQERLPKNLEKKLVHTPVTAIVTSTPNSTAAYSSINTTPLSSLPRDVTPGRQLMQQSVQLSIQSNLRQAAYLKQQQQQQQQAMLDKLLNSGPNEDSIVIPRSLALSLSNINPIQQSSASFAQLAPTVSEATTFAEIINEANLVDMTAVGADSLQSNQALADPGFDALLEQIYSLREDHNVEIPRGSDDPQAILKLLGDSLDIPHTNSTARLTNVPSAQEINEKIAISAIQKELEGTAAAIANRANQNAAVISTYSQAGRSLTQVSGTSVVQAQITPEQLILLQQQQQQQLVNNTLPPNYSLVTSRVRLPTTTTQASIINQNVLAQARRNVQVVRNVSVGAADLALLRLHRTAKNRAAMLQQQQQKRLIEQQNRQQLAIQTQQPLDVVTSPTNSNFTAENINDLLNNTVAPNVTLLRSSGIPELPGSARFNLISANSLPSPTNQTSPTSAQLSPGQKANQPFSPLTQQPFPSQTPPPSSSSYQPPPPSYPQGATSHSPSPISSAASPLMVLSPQSTSTGSPQWNQRAATSPLQNLQLQNPMLNAQLSQQASVGGKQIHLTAQQKQILRNLQASANAQNTRNIVFTQQQQQSDVNFNPVSPVMVLQSQSPQHRIQRGRIPSGTQNQVNYSTNESVLSPQSLPSPSYNQSLATTPTSAFVSISSPGVPVTYSLASSGGQHFTFERQNVQVFTTSASDSLRSPAIEQSTSDSLQAQLRIINASQNHQLSSNLNQQLLQSLTSGGSLTTTRVVNVNSLSREALEELGLSVELLPAEAQPASQVLFSQALLNESNNLETTSQPISPRVQVEEPKPDQKKSLLQQLLSEPT